MLPGQLRAALTPASKDTTPPARRNARPPQTLPPGSSRASTPASGRRPILNRPVASSCLCKEGPPACLVVPVCDLLPPHPLSRSVLAPVGSWAPASPGSRPRRPQQSQRDRGLGYLLSSSPSSCSHSGHSRMMTVPEQLVLGGPYPETLALTGPSSPCPFRVPMAPGITWASAAPDPSHGCPPHLPRQVAPHGWPSPWGPGRQAKPRVSVCESSSVHTHSHMRTCMEGDS